MVPINMKSPTFWLILVALLATWRVMADLSELDFEEGNAVFKHEFDFYVLHSRRPVLVTFSADWCAPCKRLEPVVKRAAESLDGKVFTYNVNVDTHPEVAQRFGVSSLPTMLIFDQGECTERLNTAEESAIHERLLHYVEKNDQRKRKEASAK